MAVHNEWIYPIFQSNSYTGFNAGVSFKKIQKILILTMVTVLVFSVNDIHLYIIYKLVMLITIKIIITIIIIKQDL